MAQLCSWPNLSSCFGNGTKYSSHTASRDIAVTRTSHKKSRLKGTFRQFWRSFETGWLRPWSGGFYINLSCLAYTGDFPFFSSAFGPYHTDLDDVSTQTGKIINNQTLIMGNILTKFSLFHNLFRELYLNFFKTSFNVPRLTMHFTWYIPLYIP